MINDNDAPISYHSLKLGRFEIEVQSWRTWGIGLCIGQGIYVQSILISLNLIALQVGVSLIWDNPLEGDDD